MQRISFSTSSFLPEQRGIPYEAWGIGREKSEQQHRNGEV